MTFWSIFIQVNFVLIVKKHSQIDHSNSTGRKLSIYGAQVNQIVDFGFIPFCEKACGIADRQNVQQNSMNSNLLQLSGYLEQDAKKKKTAL